MPCSRGCCGTQAEHYRSIGFAPSATPTRNPEAKRISEKERRWNRDMDAYQRIRRQGLQPQRIDGCAQLEKHAETQQEIDMGRLFKKEDLPRVNEGIERAREFTEAQSA